MDLTDTTRISNTYLPNSRADALLVRGQRNATREQTSSLHESTVTECNIGVPNVISSSIAAPAAADVPAISARSLSVNRREPTAYSVPVSESERLLRIRVAQPNSVQCSAQSDFVNRFNSPHHPVSSTDT